MVNPQVTNLIIMLGFMQIGKKIPWEDANVLNGVRAGYVLSNVLIIAIYLYIQNKISTKKDKTTIKFLDNPPMGSSEDPKLIVQTVQAYDSEQVRAAFKSQMMGVAMMAFMHIYLKYQQPLLVQSIIPLKGTIESNLFKVYILGQPAVGDLKRPWSKGSPFGLSGSEQKVDSKKAVEIAEKSGRGGVKEE